MLPTATLKVWLTAPLEHRAARAAQRDGISREEALAVVAARQEHERREWTNLYGLDPWAQESKADLVIDTATQEPFAIVNQIMAELSKKR